MKTSDFSYHLPEELIAQEPCAERDASRLMVLHRSGAISHSVFRNLADYFDEGDLLIINDSRVIPARLTGTDEKGHRREMLLVGKGEADRYRILSRGGYTGKVKFSDRFQAFLYNGVEARLEFEGELSGHLHEVGAMPLPPYIKREPGQKDARRYQTVYAATEGSIAAPTAGLHFTGNLLETLKKKSVDLKTITHHVGIGTFRPIRTEMVQEHEMETEYFDVPRQTIEAVARTKAAGRKVCLVGTTVVRAIESCLSGNYRPSGDPETESVKGATGLFITPGHVFQAADAVITNFHLPRSTPLILACAFAGTGRLLQAYEEAIAVQYRFFSYGDAMLIL